LPVANIQKNTLSQLAYSATTTRCLWKTASLSIYKRKVKKKEAFMKKKKSYRGWIIPVIPIAVVLFIVQMCNKPIETSPTEIISFFRIYNDSTGSFAISYEKIFQVTSKSQNGGTSHISGYEKARISTYDTETGNLIARASAGETNEFLQLVGVSKGKIWIFSEDDNNLFALNPRTLQVVLPADSLYLLAPSLKTEYIFNKTAFDYNVNKIVLTKKNGLLCFLDPDTFKISMPDENYSFPYHNYKKDLLRNHIEYYARSLSFIGNARKKIYVSSNYPISENLTFLEPKFLASNSIHRVKSMLSLYSKSLKKKIDSITKELSAVAKSHDYKKANAIRSNLENLQYINRNIEHDLKKTLNSEDFGLQDESYSLFVFHRESLEELSNVRLTKLKLTKELTLDKQCYDITLKNILAETKKIKEVDKAYDDNSRLDYNYTFADIINKKLFLVIQLRMICIDIRTGQILYDKRM